jgi:SnoaL-like domain
MSRTPEQIARSFSGHDFEAAFPHLAETVEWDLIGAGSITGRSAVIEACRATAAELVNTTTDFSRFRTVVGEGSVVVDSVGEYTDPDGTKSVVASCDIIDFDGGLITRITSYNLELT